jgi:hypothetical protein
VDLSTTTNQGAPHSKRLLVDRPNGTHAWFAEIRAASMKMLPPSRPSRFRCLNAVP